VIPYTIYSRKSTEDDDSQVQSISSQEKEMNSFASRCSLSVVNSLSEAKSAKSPGRPIFDEMMKQVDRGEIRGILCWKLDRLARNPVDGGRIIWAIKQHGLVVRTPQQSFSPAEDNLILMYIEFGMAQKYVDDLSRNTTRGLKAKAEKGWYPSMAPLGYLNSKTDIRGQKTIFKDPERFDAVRRMWDLMLTGNYNPARICKLANEEWGFRTRETKRRGGKPLSRSAVYKILSDPFYCGRFEYPKGGGNWYQGEHEAMIIEAEFEAVQAMLHQTTNPRPHKEFDLPFRGLIKCGECGSSITAHHKEQIRCTRCKYKSSVKNRTSCSKCLLAISDMKAPQRRRYTYYHCSRKLNLSCRQKCVSSRDLEKQITEGLKSFGLPSDLRDWGLECIEKLQSQELGGKRQLAAERKKAHDQCVMRLENLVRLKTSPGNADNSLLSDEEYQNQRAVLLVERNKLAVGTTTFEMELNAKVRLAKTALDLAAEMDGPSLQANVSRKRELLSALGLNHVLREKKLEIRPVFPFSGFPGAGRHHKDNFTPIEPENNQAAPSQDEHFDSTNPLLERERNEVRTEQLKTALQRIWKKLKPSSYLFKRFPFEPGAPVVHPRRRRHGRFI
jgi:site-specific DNA recombinase